METPLELVRVRFFLETSFLKHFYFFYQRRHPRFSAENLEKNKQIYLKMEELANKHRCSPAQLALAWVLHQGDDVIPIPGVAL